MRLSAAETAEIQLTENQIDALSSVSNWGVPFAAPSTVASLLKRDLIARTAKGRYELTEAGRATLAQARMLLGL